MKPRKRGHSVQIRAVLNLAHARGRHRQHVPCVHGEENTKGTESQANQRRNHSFHSA